ncbi:class I SAM-dependent methyltransferase [Candidatus Beckwithbacteria bacterium]|nr:class I SAM-dependent methyltransferase [Candidatus Beckwithbacteria bacterium]
MAKLNQKQNQWVLSLLDLQKDDKVLEIGFGPGLNLQKIALTNKVWGVEISKTMLQIAQKKNKALIDSGKLQLQLAPAEQLPFVANFFDTVISVHVIYFWPDLEKVFREIRRILKPSGLFVLYFVYPTIISGSHFILRKPEEIMISLKKSGFKKITLKRKSFGHQKGYCLFCS